jgi:hypothetical protein
VGAAHSHHSCGRKDCDEFVERKLAATMSAAATEDPEKLAKKAAKEAEKAAKLASERREERKESLCEVTNFFLLACVHRTQSERREERRVGCGESGTF